MMIDFRLFISGNLPFKSALKYAFWCSSVWVAFYFTTLAFTQSDYYDTRTWDRSGQDDMRWFFYEALRTSVLFSLPFLLGVALWRCSRNIQTPEQFLLVRISLVIVFIALLAFYLLSLLFMYVFAPS